MSNRFAVVMAGGMGLRLRPLTEEIPKPLLPLGKQPILEIIIERLKEAGFGEVVIACGYKGYLIKSYFGDGHNFGIKISYLDDRERRLGTAGPLSMLKGKIDKPFLVINGDIYIRGINLGDIFDYHLKEGALLTVGVRKSTIRLQYGVVERKHASNQIRSIQEKPTLKIDTSTGIYVLDPSVLEYIPQGFSDMPEIVNKIASVKKVVCYSLDSAEWMDIGDMGDYIRANGWANKS